MLIDENKYYQLKQRPTMKVKWSEYISASHWEKIKNMIPREATPSDFDNHYEGIVIGSTKNYWEKDISLVVYCTDGQIRECEADKAKKIK